MKKVFLSILFSLFLSHCYAQIITTVAGNDSVNYCCDGELAIHAGLYNPSGVAVDTAGNIYIADGTNNRIRKVNTAGIITTIAGTGTAGYNNDNIAATSAELSYPDYIALDASGNVYICDDHNFRIRMINAAGIITTIAGTGTSGYNGDNIPATTAQITSCDGIAVDVNGSLFISDLINNRIRKVSANGIIITIAGTGATGYSGDGMAATAAEMNQPLGIAVDASGNVYFSEYGNNCIRKITATGIISTIAGTGTGGYNGDGIAATAAMLDFPQSIAIDDLGNLYFTDTYNNRIRKVNTSGIVNTIAGIGGNNSFSGDNGPATLAQLNTPSGIAIDNAGSIYFADFGNNRIRRIGWPESINQITEQPENVTLYPNPGTTQLTICATNNITNIAITNFTGQIVYNHNCNSKQVQIDVAHLPTGIYFISINGSETRKFVKE